MLQLNTILKHALGQRIGRVDCPFVLNIASNQRDVKSTRLVNARDWGDCPCILTSALSQRDF